MILYNEERVLNEESSNRLIINELDNGVQKEKYKVRPYALERMSANST